MLAEILVIMYCVLVYTRNHRQCIITHMQHSWPCKLGIYAIFTHYVIAYMQVTGKAKPCVCGSIYACRTSTKKIYSVLAYTNIHRRCIIAYMQRSRPCKLGIYAALKHCMVAYMQVAGQAWRCICDSIYARRNTSKKCTVYSCIRVSTASAS
jgi:hypothetical protein